MPLSTLLPYAVDIASQGMNQAAQQQQNLSNQHFSMAQQKMAYDMNLDMWNRTNAYNTPSAQMQRMADAGLNPNLIYGNVNNAPAQNSVKVEPLEGKFQRVNWNGQSGILASQAVRMNDAQIKQMELQNKKLEAETNVSELDLESKTLENLAKSFKIHVDYGNTGKNQEFVLGDKSMAAYDLKIKEELYSSIKARVQQLALSNQWDEIKNMLMQSTGTNIDRDSSLERKGSTLVTRMLQELGYDPDKIMSVTKNKN